MAVARLGKELEEAAPRPILDMFVTTGARQGASVHEAFATASRRHFAQSIGAARRDCQELLYWLRLLEACDNSAHDDGLYEMFLKEAQAVLELLTGVYRTARQELQAPGGGGDAGP